MTRAEKTAGTTVVLLALLLSALTLRTAVTSLSPLLQRVADDVGFGTTVIGIFGMLPTLMFALGGPIAPWLARRIGLERTALAAMAATAVGIGLRPYLPGTAPLLLLSGVALLGMGIGNVVLPPLVKRYFPGRVAAISTAYLVCVQIGTTVPALIAVPLADATSWQFSLAIWAIIPIATILPWVGLIWSRRMPVTASVDGAESGAENGTSAGAHPEPGSATAHPDGVVWRSPVAWGLAGMFGMTSLLTYSLFTWLPTVITDAGGSEALGGNMVAVFSAVGLALTFVGPSLCARMENPFPVVIVCVLCLFAGLAGLLWAPMAAPMLWVVLIGIGPTTFPMALTLVNLRTRTDSGSAALSGFVQGVGYAVACVGPLLFGILHEATGGWGAPFALLLVTSAVMLTGSFHACRPRYLEDTW